ncbi:MAG: hypothetical protein AAF715_28040, partial [Myxococcota bacterium]
AIIAAIRLAGEALIAISDVALAAFPEQKAKFQAAVRKKVADAEDTVNRYADALKKSVTALFDALGEFLDKALGLLEKALLAAIEAVKERVTSALKAAEAVAKTLGAFADLVKDVAADPGGWIANLGAAVVDGIKNHLVNAMKTAISGWFRSKVEEVLGLPVDMMKALFKGGFNLAKIGKMAWNALQSAIPPILVQLLVEKLVAMVVPAAGAVMVVIEGLQAAWGSISRIIAAMGAFVSFLKAVKSGGAGAKFAAAVAASAVVVLDFVSHLLLRRLINPAKKVGGKLAGIAKRILAKIKKTLKKVGRKIKKAFKKVMRKIKKAGRKLFGRKKKRKGKKKKDKKKEKETAAEKQARLDRAMAEAEALTSGKRRLGPILRLRLLSIRRRHRLKSLRAKKQSAGVYLITGVANPTATFRATAPGEFADLVKGRLVGRESKNSTTMRAAVKGITAADFSVTETGKGLQQWEVAVTSKKDGKRIVVGYIENRLKGQEDVKKGVNPDEGVARKSGPRTKKSAAHNEMIGRALETLTGQEVREGTHRVAMPDLSELGDDWVVESGGSSSGAVGGRAEKGIDIPDYEGRPTDPKKTKDQRRADVVLRSKDGKRVLYVNVGKGLKRRQRKEDGTGFYEPGQGIARERDAERDLRGYLDEQNRKDPNVERLFIFIPYN